MKIEPSEMFKVLGVETRVRIIELLKAKGPLGVKSISSVLGATPPAVSQHLKILRQAGLVKNERKGYWIPYSIVEEALENCRCIVDEVCRCSCMGAERSKGEKMTKANLASLKKYEKELEKELENVRERISETRVKKR